MMKTLTLVLALFSIAWSGQSNAAQVAWCTGYIIGINAGLDCAGDINGEYSVHRLYQKGWRLVTDISGVASKFILVFEK